MQDSREDAAGGTPTHLAREALPVSLIMHRGKTAISYVKAVNLSQVAKASKAFLRKERTFMDMMKALKNCAAAFFCSSRSFS